MCINAEFSYESGMTVIHMEEFVQMGIPKEFATRNARSFHT
jgi:hypothetical protein